MSTPAPVTKKPADKAESRSVSMPFSLWEAVEAFADKQGHDRSSFLRVLAVRELKAADALPDDLKTREQMRVAELIEAGAGDEVSAALDEIASRRAAAAA